MTFDKEELSRELPKSPKSPEPPEPPKPPSPPSQSIQSTEARCLVYTRVRERDRERDTAGTSSDSLDFLNVRHLVPAKLQERIDQANQEGAPPKNPTPSKSDEHKREGRAKRAKRESKERIFVLLAVPALL